MGDLMGICQDDIKKAYKNGCDEAKGILKDLFPSLELGEKQKELENITKDISWSLSEFNYSHRNGPYYWMVGRIDGRDAFILTHAGIEFNHKDYAKTYELLAPVGDRGFRVLRK